ncbi:zinc ribbon domain-containing protein [Schaalia sp. Marseille-Q2122]|uniref:zinc ribbon domain-containing protein n=1 Tax=Schaalia sp. Marseille-Q2122 TaxID=2736604 RepID=UPI00158F460A|nr:hypothetical protein [Schaalia sp. Marseille-Q2122]
MTFAPKDQLLLLELATLDKRASALSHTRESHPTHEILRELAGRADDLRRAAVGQSAAIADCEREVAQIEADVEKVTSRRALQQGRIERNEVPLRDVTPMQHEIARMTERLSDLEEDQLAAEERLEAARAALTAMHNEATAIAADVEAAKARFTEDMGEVEQEMRQLQTEREALVATFPAGLIGEYDYAVQRNGALAIIEVRDGVVVSPGAHLSPAELEAVRLAPADELYWTEDTYQIVVRTS